MDVVKRAETVTGKKRYQCTQFPHSQCDWRVLGDRCVAPCGVKCDHQSFYDQHDDELIRELSGCATGAEQSTIHEVIHDVCSELARFLCEKNDAYGNSIFDPVRIFSKLPTSEQINVRIDDKLSRLARGVAAGEDTVRDLAGYLILKMVHERL